MHPVPGGYIIRPYGVDVGVCGQRTAPDPGAGGPMWASALTRRTIEPQWKSGVCPGGHTGLPYEEAEGGSVGADLYPPMHHRRTHPVGAGRELGAACMAAPKFLCIFPGLLLFYSDNPQSNHGQHRTIWQEHSAKDFASYESYKRAGILYVFPPFITARMGQKIGRRPQTQLCGDAHGIG